MPDNNTFRFPSLMQAIWFVSVAFAFGGIHFSPALASIGTIGMALLGLFSWVGKERPKGFIIFSLALVAWFTFWLILNPIPSGWSKLQIWLALPGLLSVVHFLRNQSLTFKIYTLLLVQWLMIIPAGASAIQYLAHFDFYNQMILESKPIPVISRVYHIEFNLMVAMLALLGWGVWNHVRKSGSTSKGLTTILVCFSATLTILLHLLATRTAWLAFYGGMAVGLAMAFGKWNKKQVAWGILGTLLIGGSAFLVPSIKNRIINTADDLKAVVNGENLNDKSFGQRWEAWKHTVRVIDQHKLIGVGLGRVESALFEEYDKGNTHLYSWNWKMPHNQWLETIAAGGVVALVLLGGLFISAVKKGANNLPLVSMTLVGFFLAMWVESILERQAGVILAGFCIAFASSWEFRGKLR